MTAPTALIHVQHLLGTGHVVRAAAIGRALVDLGVPVTMVCGNTVPPTLDARGLDVVCLPPVRARDAHFKEFLDETDAPIDDAWRDNRRDLLLKAFNDVRPDILLSETYPFGRRKFAFEMLPLLQAARARATPPLIASSIRDILVRKPDPRKEETMAEIANRFYDLVLVHSDPDYVRLEDSFPFTDRVAHLLRYTGFVHTGTRAEPPSGEGDNEVIVSCGGGAVGTHLLDTAVHARAVSRAANDLTWRLLVGHDVPEERFTALRATLPQGVIAERARPDFPGLLKRARLSVSQAGYNTVLDVLAAEVPAVFIPFAQVLETEQSHRAQALAGRGLATIADEKTLTPEALAQAVDAAMALPRGRERVGHEAQMRGAETSAELLLRAWEESR
ncbi:glycosyltransferase [Breoghania sp. L-A4]|uniref:glycosyltransferase family protein n=1 Tax=Breoghania sp. L-A4 TaxID=2304600 RepID=UPI000E3592A9|nr:glycosyltransferase [Breoghania sp. L-A4]AXS40008.1 glycosyltransferase [Breoghania sp. L-A4]